MNIHLKTSLILFMAGICTKGTCQPAQISLFTAQKDMMSISYDIETEENLLSIHFTDIIISMSAEHISSNQKNDYFKAVFFDRRGNLPLFQSKTNINPFQIPNSLVYTPSEDGYFFLQDHPVMTFDRQDVEEDARITVPVYLVCYIPQKEIYEVVGNAELKITIKDTSSDSDYSDSAKKRNPSATTEDDHDEIIKCISMVNILLEQQKEVQFSEMLVCEIAKLSVWAEHKDYPPSLTKRIQAALSACSSKKKELEQIEVQRQESENAERERIEKETENLRQEQLLKEEMRSKEEKRQKIWTIIICIVCSIAFSAGNQVFQYFKNIKIQKKMMELQQKMLDPIQNGLLPDETEFADKSSHLPETTGEKDSLNPDESFTKTGKQVKRFTI